MFGFGGSVEKLFDDLGPGGLRAVDGPESVDGQMFGRADRIAFWAKKFAGGFVVPVTAAVFPAALVPDAQVFGLGEQHRASDAGVGGAVVVFVDPFEAVGFFLAAEFQRLAGAAVGAGDAVGVDRVGFVDGRVDFAQVFELGRGAYDLFGEGCAFGALFGQFAGAPFLVDVFVEAVDFVEDRHVDRNAAVIAGGRAALDVGHAAGEFLEVVFVVGVFLFEVREDVFDRLHVAQHRVVFGLDEFLRVGVGRLPDGLVAAAVDGEEGGRGHQHFGVAGAGGFPDIDDFNVVIAEGIENEALVRVGLPAAFGVGAFFGQVEVFGRPSRQAHRRQDLQGRQSVSDGAIGALNPG